MTLFTAAALFLGSAAAEAQHDRVEVVSLDMGACWAEEVRPELWKIADFRGGPPPVLLRRDLEATIAAQLPPILAAYNLEMPNTAATADFYCSPMSRVFVRVPATGRSPGLCLWVDARGTKIESVFPDTSSPGETCFGHARGEIYLGARDAAAATNLIAYLVAEYGGLIAGVSTRGPKLTNIIVELTSKHWFREDAVLLKFARDPVICGKSRPGVPCLEAALARFVDLNGNMVSAGQALRLFDLDVRGE